MPTPRSRRSLLASVLPLTAAIAGCFDGRFAGSDAPAESGIVATDAYDCDDVDRPDPSMPSDGEALEPADYPEPPASVLEGADSYVREFEEAYRRNTFLAEYGPETREFGFRFETRQVDHVASNDDREAVLVAVVYHLSAETRQADRPDEWDTRVTYYVDDHVVLRDRYEGVAGDPSIDPDPRADGEPVACFE